MALTQIANLDPGLQCRNTLNAVIDLVGANHPWTANNIPFTDSTGDFAQDNSFWWNNTLKDLHIGGAYYVSSARALYVVPNVTENNWFEGNAGNQTVTGYGNFGTGDLALASVTTGFDNVAVGTAALRRLTNGYQNFAMGTNALNTTVSDGYNVAVGSGALSRLGVLGAGGGGNVNNIAIGYNSLTQAESSTVNNVVLGAQGMSNCYPPSTANSNTVIGAEAGRNLGSGAAGSVLENTFIGANAGRLITGASQRNVWVGGWQGPSATVNSSIALSTGNASTVMDFNVTTQYAWSFQMATNTVPSMIHIYNRQSPALTTTNYERGFIGFDDYGFTPGTIADCFCIGSQAGGTGVVRPIKWIGLPNKTTPISADHLLLLDSTTSDTMKTVLISALPGGGGGGMSIGGAITGGTAGRVLFAGAGGILDDDSTFTWNDTLKDLAIGGKYYVNASPALYIVPGTPENNWFEGNAGNASVTGYGNFGTGDQSLLSITSGYQNLALGTAAMRQMQNGSGNIAVGTNALRSSVTDADNIAVGANALYSLGTSGAGGGGNTGNICIGKGALGNTNEGYRNVVLGFGGLANVYSTVPYNNVVIGPSAASVIGGGNAVNNNVFIGPAVATNVTGGTGNTWIGSYFGPAAIVTDTVVLSDSVGGGPGRAVFDANLTRSYTWSIRYSPQGTPMGFHIYGLQNPVHTLTNFERAHMDFEWEQYTTQTFFIQTQAGGTGVKRLIAIGGHAKAGAPANTDLPVNSFAVIDDTSGGATWLVFNKAGTLRKVQLT